MVHNSAIWGNAIPVLQQIQQMAVDGVIACAHNDEAKVRKVFEEITKLIKENPYDPNPKHGDMRVTHPHFFVGSNKKHFSKAGVEFIHGLFAQGKEAYAAAQIMGIAYPSARRRYDEWKTLQAH